MIESGELLFVVEDTVKLAGGKIGHKGYVAKGMVKAGDVVSSPKSAAAPVFFASSIGIFSTTTGSPFLICSLTIDSTFFSSSSVRAEKCVKSKRSLSAFTEDRIRSLQAENKALGSEVESLKSKLAQGSMGDVMDQIVEVPPRRPSRTRS